MPVQSNVRAVSWMLVATIAILTLAHFALGHLDHPVWRLVNLDEEASFGTWFSSFLSLAAGSLGLLLAHRGYRKGDTWVWWALLGLVLLILSVDEVAQVHEGMSTRVGQEVRGVDDIAMAGTPILGLIILPFVVMGAWALFRVATPGAAWVVVAGLAVFWLGAFGVEELEYLNFTRSLAFTQGMAMEAGDFLLVGIQEALEMTGVGLIVTGLLRQLSGDVLEFQVVGSDRAETEDDRNVVETR